MSRIKAELIDGMYVVGDLAYLPHEWEALERDRARKREYRNRNKAKVDEVTRRWRDEHPERVKELKRESMRRARYGENYRTFRVTGSLHDLACYGPTKPGCRCRKTLVLREVSEEAA